MRLIYLDEAGISANEEYLCVAGVLIHGDRESMEVERRFDAIVDKHIPKNDRLRFVFHATDIFHGSAYFDRRRWHQADRLQILTDIADIIGDLRLPVVVGGYEKATFGLSGLNIFQAMPHKHKAPFIQTTSAIDCVTWADLWLEKYAPEENGMVIAEDADRVKPLIKTTVRTLRTPALAKAAKLDQISNVPLKRIIDTVHFAAKEDAPALQLADLCAFMIGRVMKDKSVPDPAFSIVWNNLKWIEEYKGIKFPDLADLIEPTQAS